MIMFRWWRIIMATGKVSCGQITLSLGRPSELDGEPSAPFCTSTNSSLVTVDTDSVEPLALRRDERSSMIARDTPPSAPPLLLLDNYSNINVTLIQTGVAPNHTTEQYRCYSSTIQNLFQWISNAWHVYVKVDIHVITAHQKPIHRRTDWVQIRGLIFNAIPASGAIFMVGTRL